MAKDTKTKKGTGGASALPSDLGSAEVVGFMHGTRQKIVKFGSTMYQYRTKDGKPYTDKQSGEVVPPQPGIEVTYFNTKTKAKGSPQFYSNGGRERVRATEDGKGFIPAPGSAAKNAIVKDSNAYRLLASFAAAGMDEDQFGKCLRNYHRFEGMVVDLVAQPVGKAGTLADGQGQKTIPVVGAIITLADGSKFTGGGGDGDEEDADAEPDDEAAADEDKETSDEDDEPDEDDEDAEAEGDDDEDTKDADDDEPEPEEEPEPGIDDETTELAQSLVAEIISGKKYAKTGVKVPQLAIEVGRMLKEKGITVKKAKLAKAVLGAVQDKAFLLEGPWDFDKKAQTVKVPD